MKQYIFVLFAIGLIVTASLGVSPSSDYLYVQAGHRTTCFFVMVPDRVMPFGKCYQVDDKGEPKLLWIVKGWYAYPSETSLSRTGKYLIRFLLPGPVDIPPDELKVKPYLEIYADGKFVRVLLVQDIVDAKKLPARLPDVSSLMTTSYLEGCSAEFSFIFHQRLGSPFEIPENLDESSEVFILGITKSERVMINLKDGLVIARASH